MINFADLKMIKLMRLDARYFNWTRSALIYLNLVGLVTLTVVAFQKNKEIMDYVSSIPMMLLIMTSIGLVIFPMFDIYEFILKMKICKFIDVDYEEGFVSKLSNKDIDEIKSLYLELDKSGKEEQIIQFELCSKAAQLQGKITSIF